MGRETHLTIVLGSMPTHRQHGMSREETRALARSCVAQGCRDFSVRVYRPAWWLAFLVAAVAGLHVCCPRVGGWVKAAHREVCDGQNGAEDVARGPLESLGRTTTFEESK